MRGLNVLKPKTLFEETSGKKVIVASVGQNFVKKAAAFNSLAANKRCECLIVIEFR